MIWLRLGSYSVVPPTRGGARSKLISSRTALRVSGRTDIVRERCLGCGARRELCSTTALRCPYLYAVWLVLHRVESVRFPSSEGGGGTARVVSAHTDSAPILTGLSRLRRIPMRPLSVESSTSHRNGERRSVW